MGDDFARNSRDHGDYPSTREGYLGPATFSSALTELRLCEWYWSDLSKSAAEKILRYKRIGSYLIRDSENDSHIFSLSYRGENSVYHIRIEYQHGTFSFGVPNPAYVGIGRLCAPSLVSLIDIAKEEIQRGVYNVFLYPKAGHYHTEFVSFAYPVTRSNAVPSLQTLCKWKLRNSVSAEIIRQWPLPSFIQDYILSDSNEI
ncbi:Suppressor of cytokine signaling 7 [Trichinella pseudospiralis]|uniref:Suppressor of cytokine signaling 7 n=1 Tax=Trichinella pseudospiralis TaxID=6337 RepID=A0A0V1EA61_TRIPS|nr:Suppressor of cytokine signaling 7 [Trichinella pseudospiralis]